MPVSLTETDSDLSSTLSDKGFKDILDYEQSYRCLNSAC